MPRADYHKLSQPKLILTKNVNRRDPRVTVFQDRNENVFLLKTGDADGASTLLIVDSTSCRRIQEGRCCGEYFMVRITLQINFNSP